MKMPAPVLLAVTVTVLAGPAHVGAWDNGAALTPTRGWQNWNSFQNSFNASLTVEIAHFLKDTGQCGVPTRV